MKSDLLLFVAAFIAVANCAPFAPSHDDITLGGSAHQIDDRLLKIIKTVCFGRKWSKKTVDYILSV